MRLRFIRLAAIGLVPLMLAGCNLPQTAADQGPVPVSAEEPEDSNLRYINLVRRYNGDVQWGMGRGIQEIESCYAGVSGPVVRPRAVRDCLILDDIGVLDERRRHKFYGENLAFYGLDARTARWVKYLNRGGFTSPEQEYSYIKHGAAVAMTLQ